MAQENDGSPQKELVGLIVIIDRTGEDDGIESLDCYLEVVRRKMQESDIFQKLCTVVDGFDEFKSGVYVMNRIYLASSQIRNRSRRVVLKPNETDVVCVLTTKRSAVSLLIRERVEDIRRSRSNRSTLLPATQPGFSSSDPACRCFYQQSRHFRSAALLRSGRLDRKIEFPHPNEEALARIMQIHFRKMNVSPDVNFEELSRSSDNFNNGAQCKAVCAEAGLIASRLNAAAVTHEDFMDAIMEVQAKKKANFN